MKMGLGRERVRRNRTSSTELPLNSRDARLRCHYRMRNRRRNPASVFVFEHETENTVILLEKQAVLLELGNLLRNRSFRKDPEQFLHASRFDQMFQDRLSCFSNAVFNHRSGARVVNRLRVAFEVQPGWEMAGITPSLLPLRYLGPDFANPFGHSNEVFSPQVLIGKVVGELLQVCLLERIDERIEVQREKIEPVFFSLVVIRAETVKAHWIGA